MKIYKVKVNGKVYEVEIESVTEQAGQIAAPAAPVQQAPAAPVANGEGNKVVAPMAGTILDVKVSVGQTVQVGQVVAVLEAMKLENEIVSTAAGTVKQVVVNKGKSVNNQDTIIIVG